MAKVHKIKRFDAVDVVVIILLTLWMLLIIIPFVNAIAISFATQKEYVDSITQTWRIAISWLDTPGRVLSSTWYHRWL